MTAAALVSAGLASSAAALMLGSPAVTVRRLRQIRGVAVPRRPGSLSSRLVLLAGAAAAASALLVGWPATLALAVVAAVVAGLSRRARARHRAQAARAAVVELLRAIAAELRAGRAGSAAFRSAVEAAGDPLRTMLRPASEVTVSGDPADLADAVTAVARAAPVDGLEGLTRLVACWRVAATSGATLAPAVDRVADGLQDEIELARALTTSLAGPRATVRLLAGLPLVGLLLGTAIGARPVAFLLGSPAGLTCLVVAGLFDAAGVSWARRIARRAAVVG